MAKTKAELKTIFVTGAKPTQADFHDLIEGVQGEQGPQGLQGPKGDTGAKGANGLSITAIALTTDVDGKVTGGTATFSDASTVTITVTTA